jgi:integrase
VLRTIDDLEKFENTPTAGPTPEWSLDEFFEWYFSPVYLKTTMADAATVAEYRTAVRRWTKLVGRLPLRLIDNAACASFVALDLELPSEKHEGQRISPNTVRKHCTHLQMVLSLAGPQSQKHPQAASPYGLFGDDPFGRPRTVPWFTKPPERDKPPTDGFSIEEIELLLASCRRATCPKIQNCSPAHWWRCLLRFDYNSGLRIGSVIELRRSWITRSGDEGWVAIPGKSYKGGRPKVIYLSPEAIKAVDAMPTGDVIFPWAMSSQTLQRHRKKLLAAAGISQEHWFGFHALRKATGTEAWKIKPNAAQLQLGHENQATTRKSYVNPSVLGAALAAECGPTMRRIRQPKQASPQQTFF